MKKILFYSLIISFLFFISCRNNNELQFIDKYGKEDFSEFEGKSLFVRGFDSRNPIIFVYDNTKTNRPCDMYYSFVIDKNKYVILESDYSSIPDSCEVNKILCSELAIKFCKYNINFLSVDSNQTVIARSSSNERGKRLVKFCDSINVNKEKYNDLVIFNKDWYQYSPY